MKRLRPRNAAVWPAFACLALTGCDGSPSALDPHGPAARRLADLSWALLGFLGVVTVGVLAVVALALFRRGLAQINPIWLYGPYEPEAVTTGAQPDWYLGWIEGALRLFPGWELELAGFLVPNPCGCCARSC